MSETNRKAPRETSEEDNEAITKVLAGDPSAYRFLQKKYKKVIAALIRRMIKDEDDIEDLAQETFIKAYNALSTFQFGYSFSSWLYRIASNNCIDFLRKKRFNVVSLDQPIGQSEDEQYMEVEDNTYLPDLDVLSEERRSALVAAIDGLPDNYRQIIKMRHEDELDYMQIAEMLSLPLGTVKAHLFRARKMLQDSLRQNKHLFV